jgi:hemerythrin-like domain-containing protein
MADSTVNHLRRNYQEVRRFLAHFAALLDSLGANSHWTSEHVESFRQIARFFEENLCVLIRKEDEILYPALEGLFPAESGPLSVLRSEHRDLCLSFRNLGEVGRLMRLGDNAPELLHEFGHSGRKAIEVLENHLYKEERVLLPMAARFLTLERDRDLVRQMERLRTEKDRPTPSDV